MINGYDILKEKYEDFDDDARQPNGLDLRLGEVYHVETKKGEFYGLKDNEKYMPEHIRVIKSGNGWYLYPLTPYILVVDKPIKIDKDCAQLYKPRSTLLRSGVCIFTSVGDAGYEGKLAFLFINFTTEPYFIGEGERFAQLVDFDVNGTSKSYDGDYQESV